MSEQMKLGLAAEFRVMSELLLRGHNPAKSYLEDGADIILQTGIKIEVKSARRRSLRRDTNNQLGYNFSFKGGKRKHPQDLNGFDFVICWCIDDNVFYILPSSVVKSSGVTFVSTSDDAKHQFCNYKNAWNLLERRVS